MNIQRKTEIIEMINDHFSERGTAEQFIRWASKKGIRIHPTQINRAKNGTLSAFSALTFLIYLEKIEEFK